MNEKKSWLIIILIFVMLVVATFVIIFILFKDSWFESQSNNSNNNENDTVYCTADAKMCPDGSYVGRVAPDCEFEACPELSSSSTNEGFLPEINNNFDSLVWSEMTEENLTYQMPKEIGGFNFVRINNLPMSVALVEKQFSCEKEGHATKIINNTKYCVNIVSEGAAGSVFDTYTYEKFFDDNRVLEIMFTVIFPQCMNYDGVKAEECIQEEKDFNMDYVVDKIASSVTEVSN